MTNAEGFTWVEHEILTRWCSATRGALPALDATVYTVHDQEMRPLAFVLVDNATREPLAESQQLEDMSTKIDMYRLAAQADA